MEFTPQVIANSTFPVVKRGYDADEVRSFLIEVARAYEGAAHHAAAMENRARAAVAKVHELQNAAKSGAGLSKDDAETISRTLLLAQKAADATLAEARAEAEAVTAQAHDEARRAMGEAQAEVDRLLGEARADVRRQVESERLAAQGEVQSLIARRDFLVSDVDALERHLVDQRRHLIEIADLLVQIAEQSPGGLGDVRRPALSAAGDHMVAAGGAPMVPGAPGHMVDGQPFSAEPSTDDFWTDAEPSDDAIELEDPRDSSGLSDAPALQIAPLPEPLTGPLTGPLAEPVDPTPHDAPSLLDFDRLDGGSGSQRESW